MSGHLARAIVAEVSLFRATPGIRVVQSESRAFAFADFAAAVVANENCLSCHLICPPRKRIRLHEAYRKAEGNSGGNSRPSNSPRTQQCEECTLLLIEAAIACTDDTQMPGTKVVDRSTVEILLDDGGAHIG
jgi:hypothetical protein